MIKLPTLLTLLALSLALLGCDVIPEESTIVYDVDFPRADANYGGGGSSSDRSGNTTATNDFGAGYRVSESGGSSSVTESGAGDTLTIRLVLEPLANVTLALVSVDTGEVTLSTNTLTFTPDNWNVDQTVNLSAVEDGIADGDQTTTVTVLVTGSSDKRYASDVPSTDLSVTTIDSGTIISPAPPATGAGITITQSGGNTTVTESGATDTITVVLNEAPTANVTLTIASPDGEINSSPTTVTFTPSNWNVVQTVTVSAVEDATIDGDKNTTFAVGVSASGDSNYTAVADASVPVSVIDSGRVPGIVITSSGSTNQVSENGTTTDTITLVLNTPPTDNVTVTITDNDSSELTYLPDNLTFTPSNWNVAQTVTLTAIEDYVQDNHQTTLLTMTSSSGDATNDNLSSTTEVLTVDSQTAGGITISQSSLTLSESGATDTLTFKLNTPPSGNVTISLRDNDTDDSEISYSPDNLTFDNSTWNVAQTVTFSPLQDSIVDGDQTINLDVLVSSVGDPTYGSAMNTNRTVTVNDSGLAAPTLDNATAGAQQNTVNWQTVSAATSYTLYWTDDGSTPTTSSDNITISGNISTSYVHSGLDSTKTYKYKMVANIGSSASTLSNQVSNSPSAFASCSTSGTLTDTDPDLLVHYDFNNNLNDVHNKDGDGRYNLQNTGGTIKFAQGCGHGNSAYFDPSTGYAYNDNFTDDNETSLTGNFTITMWINGDDDNNKFSAPYSSGRKNVNSNHQIDVDGDDKLRILSNNNGNATAFIDLNPIVNGQWYHVAAVHDDQDNWTLYKNGVSVATGVAGSTFEDLRIGINRRKTVPWKGYIDEFKVYGRALSAEEVSNLYENDSPLHVLDFVTAGVQQNTIAWSAYTGATSYKLYWDTSASVSTSNNLITISDNSSTSYTHSGRTAGT